MRRHNFLAAVERLQNPRGARIEQVQKAIGTTYGGVSRIAGDLLRRGWIEVRLREGDKSRDRGSYVLTAAGMGAMRSGEAAHPIRTAPPRAKCNSGIAPRVWHLVRAQSGWFELRDLLPVLCDVEMTKAEVRSYTRQVQTYMSGLTQSGYFVTEGKHRLRYILLLNDGPAPPLVSWRFHRTFDPNSNATRPFKKTKGRP